MRPIAEINLSHLVDNFNYIDSRLEDSSTMAVVKANAYGHGLIRISKTLEENGVRGLCVAISEELSLLRSSGITAPILHLGALDYNDIELYQQENNICTINSIDDIRFIEQKLKGSRSKVYCHLKFDTGLGRLGINHCEAEGVIRLIKDTGKICLSGIYSHFASSDEDDNTFLDLQIKRFKDIVQMSEALIPDEKSYHISNSTGLLKTSDSHFNMVRSGIGLYGINLIGLADELKPVMKLKAPLVLTKKILKGESVGYNRLFVADRNINVGYIQVGYADGYPLSMINTKTVFFKGELLKVVGKVSMDITAIDCTGVDIKKGDWVTLFGEHLNKIEDIYSSTDKNAYSILTGVGERVLRKYI